MSHGRTARRLLVAVLFQSCLACHLIFPFALESPDDDSSPSESSCPVASPLCWDVSGVFEQTDFDKYPPQIFGETASDGVKVHALLDGATDSTYKTYTVYCPYSGKNQLDQQTWHIERAKVGQTYKLLVRGGSDEDCSRGVPVGKQPVCRGEIRLNLQRGWTISDSPANRCTVSPDTLGSNGTLIQTYCTIDRAAGTATWQAGSGCDNCCACPDGASVDIEVEVSRN